MGSILSAIEQFVVDVYDAVYDAIDTIWSEIVAPILEEVFSWLGFEDKTVLTSYVVTYSLFGTEGWINPFKKMPINVVTFGTTYYDEIMNIFISGDHIRIKYAMSKTLKLGLEPESSFTNSTIDTAEIATIITAEVGQPITIINANITLPNIYNYCTTYLTENSATTGFLYDSGLTSLTLIASPFTTYYLGNTSDTFVFDPVNDTYDINVESAVQYLYKSGNAANVQVIPALTQNSRKVASTPVNFLANPASTQSSTFTASTSSNVLAAPAATYSVDLGPPITVTVDTAIDIVAASPSITAKYTLIIDTAIDNTAAVSVIGYDLLTLDTAIDNSSSLATGVEYSALSASQFILEDLIPIAVVPGKQYEVSYYLDSDSNNVKEVFWWFYVLEPVGSRTHPSLYPTTPVFPPGDKQRVLPILPLKLDAAWLMDSPTDQLTLDTKAIMRKYGLNMNEITNSFKDDPDPDAKPDDIHTMFVLFGLDLAKASSQAEYNYLFNFFKDYAATEPDLDPASYLQFADDLAFAELWESGSFYHPVNKGNDEPYWSLSYQTDKERIFDLLAFYTNPGYAEAYDEYIAGAYETVDGTGRDLTYYPAPTLENTIAPNLSPLIATMKERRRNNQTSYTISYSKFNITVSYGAINIQTIAGSIGDVGFLTYEIIPAFYQVKLRKQINTTQYIEVHVYDLTGVTFVEEGANNLYLCKLDFVGSSSSGGNVQHNFIIPITYGYLKEVGVIERKEILYRSLYVQMYGTNVTKLRYYETPEFGNFLGTILKVVAIISLVLTYGQSGDFSKTLWTAAKYYGTKIVAEYVVQQILLANPDSKLALAVSTIITVAVSIYGPGGGGSWSGAAPLAQGLETINAVSSVTSTWAAIQNNRLAAEDAAYNVMQTDRMKILSDAFDKLDPETTPLVDYIQQVLTTTFEGSDTFYDTHLTRSLVDTALDLDSWIDVEKLIQTNQNITIVNSEQRAGNLEQIT